MTHRHSDGHVDRAERVEIRIRQLDDAAEGERLAVQDDLASRLRQRGRCLEIGRGLLRERRGQQVPIADNRDLGAGQGVELLRQVRVESRRQV